MSEHDPVQDLVTTIIPVYNRAGMIDAAVQSVLDQTYRLLTSVYDLSKGVLEESQGKGESEEDESDEQ